jgi:signal transduction histidine kinase/ActR/RegA family two-component response regulator
MITTSFPSIRFAPFQAGALAVAALVALATLLLMPIAGHKWPNVAMFVPSYQAVLIGTYLLAAHLVYGYFLQTRIRSLLWLWSGCVYTAGVLAAQFLSLPGAFVAGQRLLGGPQTTIWLWFFWHLGAGGMLLGYAVTEWRGAGRLVPDARRSFATATAVTAAALAATVFAVTVLHDRLPIQDVGGNYSLVTSTGYGPLLQAMLFAALFFLWRASRFRTPISAWLAVVVLALALDNMITMAGGVRLSVGWYVGRLNALFSALVMLVLYMQTIHRVYLKAAFNADELAIAKDKLERHQEHLETLVRERTRSLEEAQNALLHAQKLEAMGKLTGGVAHDFNNVLHIISGNLDLIRMLAGANDKVLQRCTSARDAVRRGARLSSQLLSFARKQPLQPAPTSLAQVLADMDELLKRAVGERVRIELDVASDSWNVRVDRQQLENVILNLALNASDAMHAGGALVIQVSNAVLTEAEDARLQLGSREHLCLAFIDTGSGMSADVRERAFEPFFSTKGLGKGTGLGLSMAYGFVKQSGGHIEIDSEPGRGATVTILLPRTAEAAVEKATPQAAAAAGGTETILVVDDEIAIQDNVTEILSALGYRVLRASSADEASAVLRQHRVIDLLFTDVIMPGIMSSPQLAEVARQLHPAIGVLFTSGYSEDAVIQDGKLKQDVKLLSKPYSDDDLARAIRAALNGSKQLYAS